MVKFTWDRAKAAANALKHRVRFDEAMRAFADPLAVESFDAPHSALEDRWRKVGLSSRGQLIVVIYAEAGEKIRIISARVATRGERSAYEDG